MPLIGNPVVRVGLEDLSFTLNLENGLGDVRNRGSAVGLFLLLKKGDEEFDPEEVHAWALTHGWTEEGAASLAQIASDVNAGKKVRPKRKWAPDALERMRARARSGAPPQA